MTAEHDAQLESIAAYWDSEADGYDEHFDHAIGSPAERDAWNRVFDLVEGRRQSLDVLDIGTGTGFLALALAARGHAVTGIDLSPRMIERARRHAAARELAIEFQVGDGSSPPFPETTFDLLISRHVFWVLPDKPAVLATWRRLLRPDGCLAILDGDWGLGSSSDRSDTGSLTGEDVRRLMEGQGFQAVQIDDLADLSQALMERAAREGHPLPSFARYLVWGRR
jgi:SAM-dependent methyltransferase